METDRQAMSLNDNHDPSSVENRVLEAFKDERETTGESRMSPAMIRDRLDDDNKQSVNYALKQLTAAGWVKKLSKGIYEFVDDPRNK
jgi:hypothetical protein